MKLLKFRQPVFKKGKFQYWVYWGFVDGTWTDRVNSNESEQFVGFGDRRSVDICEGDIIKDINKLGGEITKCVIFHKGCFCYKVIRGRYHLFGQGDVEVIGNKTEHPELLNNI